MSHTELFHFSNLLQMLNDHRMVDVEFFGSFSCSCKKVSFDDCSQFVVRGGILGGQFGGVMGEAVPRAGDGNSRKLRGGGRTGPLYCVIVPSPPTPITFCSLPQRSQVPSGA